MENADNPFTKGGRGVREMLTFTDKGGKMHMTIVNHITYNYGRQHFLVFFVVLLFSSRDRIYGKSDQEPYSIDNTLLREARSTLWKCRLSKTIPNLTDLKNRLKRQIPTLLLVHKNKEITLGLKKLNKMAEN